MGKEFQGYAEKVADNIAKAELEYGVSLGRRAPMHRMHVDCIREIMEVGLKPVIFIGSINGADSPLYDPVRNPLTFEQQKQQLVHALPELDFKTTPVITLEDVSNDRMWLENLVRKLKDTHLYNNSVVHFRSKSADANAAKPLSQYTKAFSDAGLSVWQSYNRDPADDDINATAIRRFDLANLTAEQREIVAAPNYIVELAQRAREDNPDRFLLQQLNIPLTMLDLTFDRMQKEAGISTAEIIQESARSGKVDLDSLAKASTAILKKPRTLRAYDHDEHKPLLLIGNSVSLETAAHLKRDGFFDTIGASIGKFQSGEPFTEIFYGEEHNFDINEKVVKGAKAYVVQSTADPVSDHVLHLMEMIHTLKYYGAEEITVISPFLCLSRQDRPFENRFASVGADLLPTMLKAAGADKVMTYTMHSEASAESYRKVFGDNFTELSTTDIFAEELKDRFFFNSSQLIIGAPDGAEKPHDAGQKRAKEMATALTGEFNKKAMFFISKTHVATSETKVTQFEGNVTGQHCVVVDDMADGGSTLINSATTLKEHGAETVTCCITHPLLTQSGNSTALERLMTAHNGATYAIDALIISDSIPEAADKVEAFRKQYPALADKIKIVSLGKSILDEVKRQHTLVNAPQAKKNNKPLSTSFKA